jgi:hypothetical protein
MAGVETAFAVVVTVLAGACVILALVVAVVWLAVQARRLRAQLRDAPEPWERLEPAARWWRERGAAAPTIPRKW